MSQVRKKLIEVSIPLEAINKASAREKSIRHGHPSTLHLWWARRPLAACRAVLFAQLVDDPSSWPDRFPTEEAQDKERARLHRVIERMVPWEASNDEAILNAARWEIARSVAWGLGEEPPPQGDTKAILDYLQTKAPPVYDPFSGGGSIPLEAQRLGLRAYGSDLNPVAVLIGKALVEIPPKFAGQAPVNPKAQAELKRGGEWQDKRAQGLAEDVRHYGQWMRDEAERRIGHLYPKAKLADGSEATVIAWLWARTVRSPDPAAKGAMVPLVTSFMLSSKAGNKVWLEPVLDATATDGWRFVVRNGEIGKADEDRLKSGTKTGRGSNFSCVLSGSAITPEYLKAEGCADRLGARLMAVVAEGDRSRLYLSPTFEHEEAALAAKPEWAPEGNLPDDPRNFWTVQYGLSTFASLFSPRQLTALTTFSDLVSEAHDRVIEDAQRAGRFSENPTSTAIAYADAVATYLAFAVDRMVDRSSTICSWDTGAEGKSSTGSPGRSAAIRGTFSRQSLPMTWDYAEANVFSESAANFGDALGWVLKPFDFGRIPASGIGEIYHIDAARNNYPQRPVLISTDPPYYDNIGYADLSDYFYVWTRKSLGRIWPDLFRRLMTPKAEELVASPYRHGGKVEAENFFMNGMADALSAIHGAANDENPVAIYYAFKQAEIAKEGLTSPGWASFLQAIVNSGLAVDGTWPVRTELGSRMISQGANALASSIVLVCRKRAVSAATITRADFIRLLKREMPEAIDDIRRAGVGPVDMQQSVIGPGMGIFSRHAKILMDDDSPMSVRTALADINRIWGEIENEADATLDAETQVALAWFASYGFDTKPSGDLITLANAKNVPQSALFASGVFTDLRGRAQLTPREQLPEDWSPAGDKSLTVWECVQHTARVLNAEDGGEAMAARMIGEMEHRSSEALLLCGRLFQIATDKGWSAEALVYNELASEWPRLEALAGELASNAPKPAQATLDL